MPQSDCDGYGLGCIQKDEEIARLRAALGEIRDFTPERKDVPEEVWVNINACKQCQQATSRRWPPSGLCNDHYCAVTRVDDANKRIENAQGFAMKSIARGAL